MALRNKVCMASPSPHITKADTATGSYALSLAFAAQVLPLKLRPGAPAALQLLPGHPFISLTEGPSALVGHGAAAGYIGGLEPVNVMNGEALPEFQARKS